MNLPALIEELDVAIVHGANERRAEILRSITDVFVAGSAGYSDVQIELFDDVFVRIAACIERAARTALASRLANVPRAPSMITRMLASDNEIDVAGPVLERSQRLDNETLVAAAQSKSQQHLLAISRRSSLDEVVTDVLVERGDKPVVLSAAANPAARFSDKGYSTLVHRSDGDDELAACVGSRHDIPRQHLMRLLVRASHDVLLKLETANPSLAATIQEAVAQTAMAILEKSGAHDYAAARELVDALRYRGLLGEDDVAVFARSNKFAETTAALAALCDLPIEAVERAMVQERSETVMVMARAIGLSWQTAKAILRMRAGARGISPGELEEYEATFARLKPETASQVFEFQGKRTRFGRPAA